MAKKALVVGSDPVLLTVIQHTLGERGYQIASTEDSDERLTAVLQEELPDLVVVDIMMPRLDGIEVCLFIRQWSQVPIVMLSTWGAGKDKVRGLDLSADGYLTEPFGTAQLLAWIEGTLYCTHARKNGSSNAFSGVAV